MKDNNLKSKCSLFGIRIVKLSKLLQEAHKESFLSKKLLKHGTSVGFLVSEAEYEEDKENLPKKFRDALKELNLSSYWLELLFATDYLDKNEYNGLMADMNEIKMIISTKLTTFN